MNLQRPRIVAIMRELNHAAASLNVAFADAANAVLGRYASRPARLRRPLGEADDLYFAVWPDGEPVFTITSSEPM